MRSPTSRSATAAVDAVKAKVFAALLPEEGEAKFSKEEVAEAFHDAQAKVVRWNILDTGAASTAAT